jgi:hypothetical protein
LRGGLSLRGLPPPASGLLDVLCRYGEMSMPISIQVRQERTGAGRNFGGFRRGLLTCAGGALLLLSVLPLSRAEPAKAQAISSVCMDEAQAYFDAARQGEVSDVDSDEIDRVPDSAAEQLIHCLDEMLPFPDPDQGGVLPPSRTRFEIFYMHLLSV